MLREAADLAGPSAQVEISHEALKVNAAGKESSGTVQLMVGREAPSKLDDHSPPFKSAGIEII